MQRSVEHNRVFNQYAAGTKVNSYINSKCEDKTLSQQIKRINAMKNMLDGRQDCDQDWNWDQEK